MNTRHSLGWALVLTLTALPLTVRADAKQDKEIEEKFQAADKDHDGKLTLAEAKAGMPRIAKGFDKIDKDKKGFVTVEQIKAFAASH